MYRWFGSSYKIKSSLALLEGDRYFAWFAGDAAANLPAEYVMAVKFSTNLAFQPTGFLLFP
jgi:hypothetical protein